MAGNYSATGQAQQQAIWLDNYPVALISVPGTGVPELAYVQPDHLGTPRVVIDPVRDVAIWEWSNKSEVFGNQIPSADPDGDGVAFELALRFPGSRRRMRVGCSTTTSGNTTRRWGGIRRVIQLDWRVGFPPFHMLALGQPSRSIRRGFRLSEAQGRWPIPR